MPSVQKISKEQYAAGKTWFDSPYDLYKKEIKTHWDFQGWSTTADGLNIIKEEEWASHSINPDNVDYTFYAIFKLHEYDFNFYNDKDGTGENLELLKTIPVPYGSPVNMVELNKLFPWKDDSDLSLTSTYGFEGYSLTETGDVVNMATYISRKN